VIAETVKNHGWAFVGNNVVPPFLANMTIGVVLYTTYVAAMPLCTGGHETENIYPPPKFRGVFTAGALAGTSSVDMSHSLRRYANSGVYTVVNTQSTFQVPQSDAVALDVCIHDDS